MIFLEQLVQGDLFEIPFKHQGNNTSWTIGQLLDAVRPRLQRSGMNGNLRFIINYNGLYNDSELVTSFDVDGRILIEVDELPPGRPTLIRQNGEERTNFTGKTKRKNKSRRPKY